MTQYKLPEVVNTALQKGVTVEMTLENNAVIFDLRTGCKSDLKLTAPDKGVCEVVMRYSKDSIEQDDWTGLCYLVKRCMCGRDYIDSTWEKILLEEGVLSKKIETYVKYY